MDERKARLQLRIVRVTYHAEAARLDETTLQRFRGRALEMLDSLAQQAEGKDGLLTEIEDVRRKIRAHETEGRSQAR